MSTPSLRALILLAALSSASSLVTACGRNTSESSEAAKPVAPAEGTATKGVTPVTSLHDLSARTIEGQDQPLSAYRGKVALVVNTASECGFTPQYAGLEQLWKNYKDKGLVVLGFPANDFGQQEPGTDKEVKAFCEARFGVTFPLFSKSVVKGDKASPVFTFLAAEHGEPKWNFHKYLVDKKGKVVRAFASDVEPNDPALLAAIDLALAEK